MMNVEYTSNTQLTTKGPHALIFGASGISGWALVKETLLYPTPTTFARVTAVTNRPYQVEDFDVDPSSVLSSSKEGEESRRLQLVSGVDLTEPTNDVVDALTVKSEVKDLDLDSVTHVFFVAYVDPGTGSAEETRDINVGMLRTAIEAILRISERVEVVVLQTGGKAYGVEFPDKLEIKAPLKESYPRIPKPQYDSIFYYAQCDLLAEMSRGKGWTWTEIRPDVIIGAVPGTNFMNCAQGLGLYLSLYRTVHGDGATVVFPGTEKSWRCKHTDTSQDILAHFSIHAALHPDKMGDGKAYNIANASEPVTWEAKWPGICQYFGLKGAGPPAAGDSAYEPLGEFAKKHTALWNDKVVRPNDLQAGRLEAYGWDFLYFVMDVFNFDRQYDLSAARGTGFTEEVDTVGTYTQAFDRMKNMKVIP